LRDDPIGALPWRPTERSISPAASPGEAAIRLRHADQEKMNTFKKLSLSALALAATMAVGLAPAVANARDAAPCTRGSAHARQACVVDQIISNVNLGNVEQQYTAFYAPTAQFNDPTVTVNGRDAIIAHLKESLAGVSVDAIRVQDTVESGGAWMTTYEMDTHLQIPINGTPTPVGQKMLKFDCEGKIVYHRDYYDQFAVYQQIPNFAATVKGLLFQYIGSLFGNP
jgi:limonene-1,2-epoxide hydrolase